MLAILGGQAEQLALLSCHISPVSESEDRFDSSSQFARFVGVGRDKGDYGPFFF
jgi:hypothetical protein